MCAKLFCPLPSRYCFGELQKIRSEEKLSITECLKVPYEGQRFEEGGRGKEDCDEPPHLTVNEIYDGKVGKVVAKQKKNA